MSKDKAPATAAAGSAGNVIEGMLLSFAANRYIWLALGLAGYLIAQLTLLQYGRKPWFETEDLIAHSMFIVELALLATVLLSSLELQPALERYTRRNTGQVMRWQAAFAQILCVVLAALLLLLPLMLAYNNPELASQGLRFPLTILQRGMLLVMLALVTLNTLQIIKLYLRLPQTAVVVGTVLWHSLLALLLTWLSTQREAFQRLNDVFYYNQLHTYSELFPDFQLQDERLGSIVYHNIEMPWFGYYLAFIFFLWLAGFMLWMARGRDKLYTAQSIANATESE